MLKQTITIDETLEFLNNLLEIDSKAVNELFRYYVYCNEDIANHPTIQVLQSGANYQVGILGLLNGLFGIHENGWGAIVAIIQDREIVEFVKYGV